MLNRVTDCSIFKKPLGGFKFSIASSLLFYVETKPSLFFLFDSTIIHSSDVCVSSLCIQRRPTSTFASLTDWSHYRVYPVFDLSEILVVKSSFLPLCNWEVNS